MIGIPQRLQEIRNEYTSVYITHGAGPKLARAMATLWDLPSYSPSGTLTERIKNTRDAYHFKYLAFAMLLKGETEEAKKYLRQTIKLDNENQEARTVRKYLNKVQQIIAASKADLDRLRIKYQGASLETILLDK